MAEAAAAATALGLISAVITIADTIKRVYEAAQDAQGLPLAFREVSDRLPLVKITMEAAKGKLATANANKATIDAVTASVEKAKASLEKLELIFTKCVPAADASHFERYVAAVRTLGKDHKVEVLMKVVLENVQDLANNSSVGAATAEQVESLRAAIQALSALETSVPDGLIEPQPAARNFHSGKGDINAAEGHSHQQIAKDNARQYIGTTMTINERAL